ncbi:DUF7219 family protein [Lyngbya confervoides]|uniref:Isopropylmalate/homocitrate/citramalate synthase n=1 Tax=Lyngbya confervoides BDU141951 TaxID=1574623 RepID=A0ABD4T0Z6_9CYAN|nr:hypothetical protein [Lyngbya confervoides]MCM1981972.1 hypothetical protein [Lyngbya confervoides BDU141951]
MSASEFLRPYQRYRGAVKPENLVFNANLQEFAYQVVYISSLESNGKITPEESYAQIKNLWKSLKQSKKHLRIGENPFSPDEDQAI